MPRNFLTDLQRERNVAVASHWDLFQPHRERITALLCDGLEPESHGDRLLCVLGAGNCNDLDLNELSRHFGRIDLVDIDSVAMENGVQSQACDDRANIKLHGNCDITGVWPELLRAKQEGLDDVDVLIESISESTGLSFPGSYSVVASTCLLSQLMEALTICVGQDHPRFLEIASALRIRHLRLISELLGRRGRGLLVTDFVSSDTIPNLSAILPTELPPFLSEMIDQGNFFTALNPFRIASLFQEDSVLSKAVVARECETPWIWNLGPRQYAVTAIPFHKL